MAIDISAAYASNRQDYNMEPMAPGAPIGFTPIDEDTKAKYQSPGDLYQAEKAAGGYIGGGDRMELDKELGRLKARRAELAAKLESIKAAKPGNAENAAIRAKTYGIDTGGYENAQNREMQQKKMDFDFEEGQANIAYKAYYDNSRQEAYEQNRISNIRRNAALEKRDLADDEKAEIEDSKSRMAQYRSSAEMNKDWLLANLKKGDPRLNFGNRSFEEDGNGKTKTGDKWDENFGAAYDALDKNFLNDYGTVTERLLANIAKSLGITDEKDKQMLKKNLETDLKDIRAREDISRAEETHKLEMKAKEATLAQQNLMNKLANATNAQRVKEIDAVMGKSPLEKAQFLSMINKSVDLDTGVKGQLGGILESVNWLTGGDIERKEAEKKKEHIDAMLRILKTSFGGNAEDGGKQKRKATLKELGL